MLLFICCSCSVVVQGHATSPTPQMNFRRDYYLDESLYPEGIWAPIPKEGGRVQIVSDVSKDLNLSYPLTVDLGSTVMILDDSEYPDNVPSDGLDWVHSRYNGMSGTLLTSFHMHNDDKIKSVSKLKVHDSKGLVIVDDSLVLSMETPKIQITYATTRNNFKELVVHFHNYDTSDHIIDSISINSGFYTFDGFKMKDGEHIVKVFDVKDLHHEEVSVWSVVLSWGGSESAGFGGRFIKELFPIEDWPKSEQCPFPVDGANKDNFKILRDDLHINTHFLSNTCDADDDEVFEAAANSNGEWYVLPTRDYFEDQDIPNDAYPGIAAAFLGDESDTSVEDSWEVWRRVMTTNELYPEYSTYDGGHSNHLNGLYAGVTDIQGMDFYVAACAPHITNWLSDMPLQGSYDYLFTARQNQKPLPTWLYSQGWCADCWSVDDLTAGEILVELASVVAAGGKGMMLFQSDVTLQGGSSWTTGGKFLHSVQLISEFLRQADVEGARYSTDATATDAITQVLHGPSQLLFIAINLHASGYNDKTCALSNSHWIFEEQTIGTTTIEIPADLEEEAAAAGKSVAEYFHAVEVVNGKYLESPDDVDMALSLSLRADGSSSTSTWVIESLKLGSSSTTARMFMLLPKN